MTGLTSTRARGAARHRRNRRHAAILSQSLVAAEEERPILCDRTAQISAKLIPFERREIARRIVEEGARVEPAVAIEFEQRAFQRVRPRARHRRHDAAGAPSIFRAVVIDEDLKLPHRFHAEESARGAPGGSVALRVRVGAVELIADLIRSRAGNRDLRPHPAIHLLLGARRRRDARLQQGELTEIAAVQRQLANLFLVHERGNRGLAHIDHRRFADDGDLLVDTADLELDAEHGVLTNSELKVRVTCRAEALQLDGQLVPAGRQRLRTVPAGRVGDEHALLVGLDVTDGDRRAGQSGVRIIGDEAGNGSGRALGDAGCHRGAPQRDRETGTNEDVRHLRILPKVGPLLSRRSVRSAAREVK